KINSNKKDRVRIAIPTNDGINIFPKMLGMAKKMFIYEIENGTQFRLIEKRNNPYESTMQHLKTLDVYNLIDDCSIIISAHIGKKGITRLQERGVKLFFRKENIEGALADVVKEEGLIVSWLSGWHKRNAADRIDKNFGVRPHELLESSVVKQKNSLKIGLKAMVLVAKKYV
ncbi:MAG: NifB/NifX family molybdenum-iron cluster-binding protein, partial [Acidobacteriota bacterium]|nr:NifB/NifX family molybdenum-iron cluster-binding protein [Acidobacteriota bacterium]